MANEETSQDIVTAELKNRRYFHLLAITIFLGVLLNFLNIGLMKYAHIQDTSALSFIIYMIVLVCVMSAVFRFHDVTILKVICYLAILFLFGLNFIIFAKSRTYLLSKEMLLIYIFYLPVSVFLITSITDWDFFIGIFIRYAAYAVIIGTVSILILNVQDYIDYMQFSYSLIVFIMVLYFHFREHKKLTSLIYFIVGILDILIYGARGPILFIIAFIVIYETLKASVMVKLIELSSLAIAGIAIFFFNDQVVWILTKITELTGSRFFLKLLDNNLLYPSGRDIIYREAFEALKEMNIRIYGLFGDRFVVNATYVHNIFLEMLLSFGFIAGFLIIFMLIALIVKTIMIKDQKLRMLAILFTCALFFRYLISGSFLIEGSFYMYIALMLNLIRSRGIETGEEKLPEETLAES